MYHVHRCYTFLVKLLYQKQLYWLVNSVTTFGVVKCLFIELVIINSLAVFEHHLFISFFFWWWWGDSTFCERQIFLCWINHFYLKLLRFITTGCCYDILGEVHSSNISYSRRDCSNQAGVCITIADSSFCTYWIEHWAVGTEDEPDHARQSLEILWQ